MLRAQCTASSLPGSLVALNRHQEQASLNNNVSMHIYAQASGRELQPAAAIACACVVSAPRHATPSTLQHCNTVHLVSSTICVSLWCVQASACGQCLRIRTFVVPSSLQRRRSVFVHKVSPAALARYSRVLLHLVTLTRISSRFASFGRPLYVTRDRQPTHTIALTIK